MAIANIKKLPKAVNRWLGFQQYMGRDILFSESYISQPVSEFLMYHHTGDLKTEYIHPLFISAGPGRPRQVDYALLSPNKNDIMCALEAKWTVGISYDKQRIIDDLIRLQCMRTPKRHVERYFIVGGKRDDFNKNFRDIKINANGFRIDFTKHFLSFDPKNRSRIINCIGCPKPIRKFYTSFENSYAVTIPRSFETRLISFTNMDDISVYLWKISGRKGIKPFSPATLGW
ncbi:hypothetical protein ACU81Q_13070 [Komagataeibacter melomenusus]